MQSDTPDSTKAPKRLSIAQAVFAPSVCWPVERLTSTLSDSPLATSGSNAARFILSIQIPYPFVSLRHLMRVHITEHIRGCYVATLQRATLPCCLLPNRIPNPAHCNINPSGPSKLVQIVHNSAEKPGKK